MKDNKPLYKKWWVYAIAISVFVGIIYISFMINDMYKKGGGYITVWGSEDVLSFYGSFLAFIGTVSFFILALWQNSQYKKTK